MGPHSATAGALLTATWLAVVLLAASPSAAADRSPSVTLGPIRVVPGTHLVIGGGNTGASTVTLRVAYEASDELLAEEFFIIPPPPQVRNKTGVRSFGGDSSGILGRAGSPGVMVTITALEGALADIVATVQLVDDETDRPIVILAKPCKRCD